MHRNIKLKNFLSRPMKSIPSISDPKASLSLSKRGGGGVGGSSTARTKVYLELFNALFVQQSRE